MPKTHVSKSIVIKKPQQEVYEILADFTQWQPWSPWLIMEEGVKINVREDKKFYEWEGDIVGAGNMTILNEKKHDQIDYDLTFLKPWKSKASVSFLLKQEGENTKVTWTMDSSLPFFLFFMKKMMENFIGMDFERGLKMLKNYTEDGFIPSKMNFKGNTEFAGAKYIGIKTTCPMDKMGDYNKADYEKLMPYVRENHASIVAGAPFSIYHKWDIKKEEVTYTACIPVNELPSNLDKKFITGEYPKTTAYSVEHIGSYEHLGNPWTAVMMRQRGKKFKANKKVNPIEVYLNNPQETPEAELKTEILIPTK